MKKPTKLTIRKNYFFPVALGAIMSCVSIVSSCKKTVENSALKASATDGKVIENGVTDYNVNVSYSTNEGSISKNVFGYNAIYDAETDALWNQGAGPVAVLVDALNPGQLRWPGGTVTTFYHWKRGVVSPFQNDGIQGHSDSWDPAYDASKDKANAGFMNLDEYLATKTALGTTPLIGINMGSGKRFSSRRLECRNEAVALVNYVKSQTPTGSLKYFYLDNEPYMDDANYTYTPASYAAEINYYVPALKAADPNIKIIVNSKNEPTSPTWTPTIIQDAGANIDYIDVHFYWRFNGVSFALWTGEAIMQNQASRPFSDERAALKAIAASKGYPNIDLVAFEWNVGRNIQSGAPTPTEAEVALMVSEQLTEFIQSGMPMACYWPIQFPGNPGWNRALLDATQSYTTNKVYDMFKLYNTAVNKVKITGTASVASSGDKDRIRVLAMKTTGGGNQVQVFLINKDQTRTSANLDISIPGFNFTGQTAVGFESTDTGHGSLNAHALAVTKSGTSLLKLTMPKNSFAKITLTR